MAHAVFSLRRRTEREKKIVLFSLRAGSAVLMVLYMRIALSDLLTYSDFPSHIDS